MATSIKLDNNTFWDGEICERGTANGGDYIRFANGIQICAKKIYTTAGTSSYQFGNNQGVKISLGNQPAAFTQLWAQFGSYYMTGNTRVMNGDCFEAVSNTSMGSVWLDRPGGAVSAAGYVEATSIGRWK